MIRALDSAWMMKRSARRRAARVSDACGLSSRAGRGFTLIETLVAIGAVAIVAVGLAAIFDSVGKTVTGGRRTSRLTSFASIIEGQFRKDFDAMIHDKGVLVIRQNMIRLGGADFRRADEITFFARGDFKSVRTPIHPSRVPTSDVALIYYGHGEKQTPDVRTGLRNTYLYPATSPYKSGGGQHFMPTPSPLGQGENAKVSDWTLLRHATLLVKPQLDANGDGRGQRRPEDHNLVVDQLGGSNVPNAAQRILDTPTQFALQPAAPSIFRNVARQMQIVDSPFAPADNLIRSTQPTEGVPSRSSGLVDIATGDLDEIRAMIETGLAIDGVPSDVPGLVPAQSRRLLEIRPFFLVPAGQFKKADLPPDAVAPRRNQLAAANSIDRMHAWMNDLFPAQSDTNPDAGLYRNAFTVGASDEQPGERMRYEPSSPGLLDVTDWQNPDLRTLASDPAMMKSLYADQVAITSSSFLPRCTNFIVEWTFGETLDHDVANGNMRAGDVLWYGPERHSEPSATDRLLALPYPFVDPDSNTQARPFLQPYPLLRNLNELRYYEVSDQLIYGFRANAYQNRFVTGLRGPESLTSYFGYVDPSFDYTWPQRLQGNRSRVWAVNPTTGLLGLVTPTGSEVEDSNADGDKGNDPTDSAIRTLPWAWPKMIRITLSLADPRDANVEETFQYIFSVPERGQ